MPVLWDLSKINIGSFSRFRIKLKLPEIKVYRVEIFQE